MTDVLVSWTAPDSDVTTYTVTVQPGGASYTVDGAETSTTIPLSRGVRYQISVTANTSEGSSAPALSETFTLASVPAESYAAQLKHLLPPGRLWNLEAGSWLSKVLLAVGDELRRIAGRAEQAIDEWDPRTTTEMIGEWETMLGLPDNCAGDVPTELADRRTAVVQRFASKGGQSRAFFTQLGASIGLAIEIEEYRPLRTGFRVGDRCYSTDWAHVFMIKLPIAAVEGGAVAGSEVGSYLGDHGDPALECVFRRAAPAHSIVLFSYV